MPHSERGRLARRALFLGVAIYASVFLLLTVTANWAERSFATYPYFAGEDPMRMLLPTLHGKGGGTLLLGTSAIGEAFLYEVLEDRWKSPVRSGSLSNGSVDDFNRVLEYMEGVYGADALPDRIVLGMTVQSLANEPRYFGPRAHPGIEPVTVGFIQRYGERYSVAEGDITTSLIKKTPREAFASRMSFYLGKQQPRFRSGVLALLEHVVDPDPLKLGFQESVPPYIGNLRRPFSPERIGTTFSWIARDGPWRAFNSWMRAYRSAYNNMMSPPVPDSLIRDEVGGSQMGAGWDPVSEREMVELQLRNISEFTARHDIELVVVFLPAHPLLRDTYLPDHYANYNRLVRENLHAARFVDIYDQIPAALFFDENHLIYEGARIATERLVAEVPAGPEARRPVGSVPASGGKS